MKKLSVTFEIPQKEILNSNTMPSHFIVKGNMVARLRELAAQRFALEHPEPTQEEVQRKLHWLRVQNELQMKRLRLRRKLMKDGLSKADAEKEALEHIPEEPKEVFEIPALFHRFSLLLVVMPPTRRRVDPPNLWPSLKALGDGVTDAGIWEDDSFEFLLETSFRYGGLSGLKGVWKLQMIITEIEDLEGFKISPEAPE